MKTSEQLAMLRDLQKLREERFKAEHSRTISEANSASSELSQAKDRLEQGGEALSQYSREDEFELSRFQILAGVVNQLEAEANVSKAKHDDAAEQELAARSNRTRAEKQSDHLSDRHHQAVKHERRRHEDRVARDFLSSLPVQKDAVS